MPTNPTSARLLRTLAIAVAVLVPLGKLEAQSRTREQAPLASEAPPEMRDALRRSVFGNYLAARAASHARDNGPASTYWRAALRKDPSNPELLERAFIATLSDGQLADAFPLAERIVGIDRHHVLGRLTLAVRAIQQGQFQTARSNLSGISRAADELTANLLMGWVHLGLGDSKAAMESLEKVRGPEWYSLFRNYHSGLVLDLAGKRPEAGQKLEAAYKQDQALLRIVEAYGRWVSRAKGIEASRDVFNAYLKVVPEHLAVETLLKELDGGKPLAPIVGNAKDGAAEVLYGLGAFLARQGVEELGLVYLQMAVFIQPQHALAQLSLAELYELMKKYDKAVATYARVPEKSAFKRNAEIQMGLNLDALDRTDEALQHLKALIAARPKDIEAIQAHGNILLNRKRYEEAAAAYTKAVDQIPAPQSSHWGLFYSRGIAFERAKNWPKAEADLKKALDLVPENQKTGRARVLNYLGYSWIDQGMHLEEGLQLVRKAVELRPDDGYIVDSLAWAYYRLGRYEDAVTELERAIELRPEDPAINDHLGDAYWRVGRKLEANFQWAHARDLKPEPEDLVRILDKLKNGLNDSNSTKSALPSQDAKAPGSGDPKSAN